MQTKINTTEAKISPLYDYFLHFNAYTGYWCAVPRTVSNKYLNGSLDDDIVLKNKDINVLIGYINKL